MMNYRHYHMILSRRFDYIADSSYGDISNLPEIVVTSGGYGGQISTILEAVINEWRVNLGVEVSVRQLDPNIFILNFRGKG